MWWLNTKKQKGLEATAAKFDFYRHTTARLCNQYIASYHKYGQPPDPTWRNEYYAQHVDHVQAILERVDSKEKLIRGHLTLAGYPGIVSSNASPITCNTPLSARSIGSSATVNSPPSSATSFTLSSQVSLTSLNSSIETITQLAKPTSPSPTASNSSSFSMGPPPRPHPLPSDEASYCDCDVSFRGANRASNLRRHQKTAHHQGDALPCGEPGCDRSFGRPDHLRIHRKKSHNVKTPLTRQQKPRLKPSHHDKSIA